MKGPLPFLPWPRRWHAFLVVGVFLLLPYSLGAQNPPALEAPGTISSIVPLLSETLAPLPDGLGLAPENDLLQARQRAISLAGAFANDGYRLRDGSWSFYISENQPAVLMIWLFARNGVWFSAATAEKGASPKLEVFTPDGHPLPTLEYLAPGASAVGFVAPTTGKYFVRATFPGPLTPFCLVTSYK